MDIGNKINIAKLLKDCPKGMELDCTICNNVVTLEGVDTVGYYPIRVMSKDGFHHILTHEGCVYKRGDAKCVIYPKGKTTWEGFVPPCQFKDGDVVFSGFDLISIYKEQIGDRFGRLHSYVSLTNNSILEIDKDDWTLEGIRFATEEEKAKLFQVIKDNEYQWNEETKTLVKLVEPKFKEGDRVMKKGGISVPVLITGVGNVNYCYNTENSDGFFKIKEQDDWELVPNKFDITTLKSFDKVLVRDKCSDVWTANFYSHYDATSDRPFVCVGWSEMNEYRYCIPYEANKELLGTTNNIE